MQRYIEILIYYNIFCHNTIRLIDYRYNLLQYIASASDNFNAKLTKLNVSLIRTRWLVTESLLILYIKVRIVISSDLVQCSSMLQSTMQYGVDLYCCIPRCFLSSLITGIMGGLYLRSLGRYKSPC